jgi:hypothetical protein
MSFIYSRALVEASLRGKCLGTAASALLSASPTPQGYSSPDKTTALSRLSRFGMTFKPLTADLGAELLTSWLAGFPARTFQLLGKAQALKVPVAGCGPTWRASLAKFDPVSSSWKTAQLSLLGDSELSSVTWPRSGMTAGGQCWELLMSAPPTEGIGSGLSGVPTPGAQDGSGGGAQMTNLKGQIHLRDWARTYPTPTASQARSEGSLMQYRRLVDAGVMSREEAEEMCQGSLTPPRMKPWPTPTASEHTGPGHAAQGGLNLRTAVSMWPTPTVCGNHNRKGASATSGDGLATAVLKVATPIARDWRSGKASQATHDKNSRPLSEQIGGSLNPTWVEALMGWPRNWTQLAPLTLEAGDAFAQDIFGQAVPSVRADVQPQADAERQARGCSDLSAPTVLLSVLCEQSAGGDARCASMAGQEAPEGCLRGVRVHQEAACSPLRPEPIKQRPEQLANALPALPRLLAHNSQEAWASGRFEDAIPRVAVGVTARVDRLKAIGNGQVPQCAAAVWRRLTSTV